MPHLLHVPLSLKGGRGDRDVNVETTLDIQVGGLIQYIDAINTKLVLVSD